jgi:hypothetical protein
MHTSQRFTIFADYFQFVLMDQMSTDDFSLLWTDEALGRMLAVGTQALCLGTLRNVDVSIEVRVWEVRPVIDLSEFDHAVEASIHLPSGTVVIMGCTGYLPDSPKLKVQPGNYRVLSLASGIETTKNEWEPADDLYTVYLWPGERLEPRLLKHWKDAKQTVAAERREDAAPAEQ